MYVYMYVHIHLYVCMHVCMYMYSFIHVLQLCFPSHSRNVWDSHFFPVIGCEVLFCWLFHWDSWKYQGGAATSLEEHSSDRVPASASGGGGMKWTGRGAQSTAEETDEQTAGCNTVSRCHGSIHSECVSWELWWGAVESAWAVREQAGQWWLQGSGFGSGPQRMQSLLTG